MNNRPSWDETWMSIAFAVSKRSKCEKAKIGAVLVDSSNRIVATGYNGQPQKMAVSEGCSDWCPRGRLETECQDYSDCLSIHAEINCLLFADRRSYEGGTLYVSGFCCWNCAKAVANSGVAKVVMSSDRVRGASFMTVEELFEACGISLEKVEHSLEN